MITRLRRGYRRWRWYRKVRTRGVNAPRVEETMEVMADWIHIVAEGFHKVGDHDRENDVMAVGRSWAAAAEVAYKARDVEQLRAVCVGACEAILDILNRTVDEDYPELRARLDRERAS